MRIYVASSWRNEHQPDVVKMLRSGDHQVYDFRDPAGRGTDTGFHWSDIDREWQGWNVSAYRAALETPQAHHGFMTDYAAMQWAEAFVLVQPCGRSAHLELGWAMGQGKPSCIHYPQGVMVEPELMNKLAHAITANDDELKAWVGIVGDLEATK